MNEEIKNEVIVDEKKTNKAVAWVKAHAWKLGIGALAAIAGAFGIWALAREAKVEFEDEAPEEEILDEVPEESVEDEK